MCLERKCVVFCATAGANLFGKECAIRQEFASKILKIFRGWHPWTGLPLREVVTSCTPIHQARPFWLHTGAWGNCLRYSNTNCNAVARPIFNRLQWQPYDVKCFALLWSPYEIGQTIIFLPCGFFFLLSFFSSPNLSRRRLDVCHTSTHGVALVRI